ncbi:fas apoptotic inhibitory molecule 1 [Frankliniella occidentalis]|uniref:Fas apoptotic inhibitory molecule 1 n=1 Tax=Frankliniella occidentalis TaxID=133901 RepID=A0A6J1T355_FRAOC|nr:fas apoptotic inhibitory molecule 1 [Frankliniella occidentalis]
MPFHGDLVGAWEVTLSDGVHSVEFEHGTTTGKRVIRVDGKEIVRRDWMFKLVGPEVFLLGKSNARCVIKVEPVGGFSYSYELEVNGKSYHKFNENQSRAMRTWLVNLPSDEQYRVVLEKDTLDIWANGQKLEATGEFVEDGTETHFTLGSWPAIIKAVSSGNRREGIVHSLIVNDRLIPEATD